MGLMFQAQFRSKYKPSKYKYKRVYNYLAEVLGVARGIKKKNYFICIRRKKSI